MPDYTQILEEVVALRAESAALRAEMDALKAALIRVEALTDAMNEELASMAGGRRPKTPAGADREEHRPPDRGRPLTMPDDLTRARPMDTARRQEEPPLLLFCSERGGWRIGVRLEETLGGFHRPHYAADADALAAVAAQSGRP